MLCAFISVSSIGLCQFGSSNKSSVIAPSTAISSSVSRADSVWKSLPELGNLVYRKNMRVDSVIMTTFKVQEFAESYRTMGLQFWREFRNDFRRYEWFLQTLERAPSYWMDMSQGAAAVELLPNKSFTSVPVDVARINSWKAIYQGMRDTFLLHADDSQRKRFYKAELYTYLYSMHNPENREGKKLSIDSLHKLYNNYILNATKENDPNILRAFLQVVNKYSFFGLTIDDRKNFVRHYQSNENKQVRDWAKSVLQIYKLEDTPLRLTARALDGTILDLRDYTGKIVLVDFWSISCSPCIARMKQIRPVYEKYKNKGFEIISVCIDSEDRVSDIKRIKNDIGADWPTVIIGGKTLQDQTSLKMEIFSEYGFISVPQLILLDRDGKMLLHNGSLSRGDLEPIITSFLTSNSN